MTTGLGPQRLDAGGDEIRDALHGGRRQRPVRLQPKDDRRLGRLFLVDEERVFRHRDVDARAGHFGERRDRARQLAFERAPVVHVLEKLRRAERGAVEDLEADAARRRQAVGGHRQAQLVHFLGRDAHGPSAVGQLVGDLLLLELADRPELAVSASMSARSSVNFGCEIQYAEPTTTPTTARNTGDEPGQLSGRQRRREFLEMREELIDVHDSGPTRACA